MGQKREGGAKNGSELLSFLIFPSGSPGFRVNLRKARSLGYLHSVP